MPGFAIGGNGSGPNNTDQFHRVHRWRVASLGIPSSAVSASGSLGGTRTRSGAGGGVDNRPISYVKSLQLPSLSFEEEKVMGSSIYYKFAKSAVWEDVTVKFYDVYRQYEDLRTWQRAIWLPETGLQPANVYKGMPVFELIDHQGRTVQRFELINAYPKKVDHGDLTMTSSEIKIISVVFSFDWANIFVGDSNAISASNNGTTTTGRSSSNAEDTAAAAAASSNQSRSGQVPGGIGLGSDLSGFSLGSIRSARR